MFVLRRRRRRRGEEAELLVDKNHMENRELQPRVSSHSRWGSKKKKGKPVRRALDRHYKQRNAQRKRLKGNMEKAF